MKKPKKERLLPIYLDGAEYYVRFAPIETQRFPHGLAFNSKNKDEEKVKQYRDDIWEYLLEAKLVEN